MDTVPGWAESEILMDPLPRITDRMHEAVRVFLRQFAPARVFWGVRLNVHAIIDRGNRTLASSGFRPMAAATQQLQLLLCIGGAG